MSNTNIKIAIAVTGLVLAAILVPTFERPPVVTDQGGFRGTSMGAVVNPRIRATTVAANQAPAAPEAADNDGDRVSTLYQNVQLLGDLSNAQFLRIMQAMTEWVVPQEVRDAGNGCAYCHNIENMASDEVYTKVVSRRMLQMVRTINNHPHVGQNGVTCYTCHRGRAVPAEVWSTLPMSRAGLQAPTGQNQPSRAAAGASLALDPFTPYLLQDRPIRAISRTSLPGYNDTSIQQTESTYSLMMHMSAGLGVNCTFCHNSRSFAEWAQSPPQRTTAWHGIRMVRDVNMTYIEPLTPLWQANPNGPPESPRQVRLGAMGDALKVNCATCHRGVNRPLNGAPMLQDYPELRTIRDGPARSAALAPQ
ncbi:photosynthetic reaction center cytochrome c subunit [Roseomonas sp. PWR1]|uniref:Photosynthetic reaction center cytochrome c subunit n=1 Tax=Roseomonas nitratireducens TaxID=2820810 RepID=A0ABS4APR8_9PROT|nr:photosynthetic reaction center cytochrome PufC [Neoroseomonas nitratireducens]MBP0463359.1 photosynthetic reaction center cytochrome c subunit [Neoroseomonas nitratireducens]